MMTVVLHAIVSVALLVLKPSAASAHGALRKATPASGSVLSVPPTELRLTFSERTELPFTRIVLLTAGGDTVPTGAIVHDAQDQGRTVRAQIRSRLAAGAYRISWQIAGRDGHPVRGSFGFTVLDGVAGAGIPRSDVVAADSLPGEAGAHVVAPGQGGPEAAHHTGAATSGAGRLDADSLLYVIVRGLLYLGIVTVTGATAFRLLVLRRARDEVDRIGDAVRANGSLGAARLGMLASMLLVFVAAVRFVVQSVAMHGADRAFDPAVVGAMMTSTLWGWGWVLQLAAAVLALAAFRAARHGSAAAWTLSAVAVTALAITPALSGHAAAARAAPGLAIAADTIHVLAAGVWIGQLLILITAGIPATRQAPEGTRASAVAAMFRRFSPMAMTAIALLFVTGLFAAWEHLGSVSAVWQSAYGRTLLLKLAVLALVAGTGFYNWRFVLPLLGTDPATRHLGRSARVEVGVGIVVLLVTAVLVALPTPENALR